jgi:hypothetical protein
LKIQGFGAWTATTFVGQFEGLAIGSLSIAWEPDSVLYGLYAPDQPRNSSHINDPKLTAMLKAQRRIKDWRRANNSFSTCSGMQQSRSTTCPCSP